jgi:hypothetical protein
MGRGTIGAVAGSLPQSASSHRLGARELFTRLDTGHTWSANSGAGFKISVPAIPDNQGSRIRRETKAPACGHVSCWQAHRGGSGGFDADRRVTG